MTQQELLDIILYLVPNAKVCIKEVDADPDDACTEKVLSGYKVCWNKTNELKCPTQTQINNVDLEAVALAAETRRKDQRDNYYKDDVNIKVGLQIARAVNPSITLREYLDNLGI
jgi:tRNA(Ser,Leu) C12 N-acetylase TAN1